MAHRAIITGAGGLIGQYLVRSAPQWAPGWEVWGVTRTDLDLTDSRAVERKWQLLQAAAVIHCAALSRTRDCEQNHDLARRINAEATTHLARLSKNIPFFFLSSGEVFDGIAGWYRETDKPNPINVYGKTKLEAEQVVLDNPRHTVVRIVLTAGTSLNGDRSFVEDMCRTAQADKGVALYSDEYRCPLPAGVIARALWELLAQNSPGLYHLGGSDRLSRWEIGQALLPWYPQLKGRLIKTSSCTHRGAPRPMDLSLNYDKIQRRLSFRIPGFREWLAGRSHQGLDLWDYEPGIS